MSLTLLPLVVIIGVAASQDCDWPAFFKDSNAKCSVSGVEVDCPKLNPNSETVIVSCSNTLKLTGYSAYHCEEGIVLPRVYSSSCVPADTLSCPLPSGRNSNNMQFVRDGFHQYTDLQEASSYHVTCKEGFMFRDGVDPDMVMGRCEYVNRRSTIVSETECLPACPVQDNNQLSENIDFLDRITIIYPSDVQKVGEGKVVHAKALCNNGYSPLNQTVELQCTTAGVEAANSGYYLQSCQREKDCLQCAKNCDVPDIPDATVFSKAGAVLEVGSPSVHTGEMTAYVTCAEGTSLLGSRHISCREGNYISELPECSSRKLMCSPPVIDFGYTLPDVSSRFSDQYTVYCNPGYTLGDPQFNQVDCELPNEVDEASYSVVLQCHMGCSVPSIKNGAVTNPPQLSRDMAPFATEETVEVVCNAGFVKRGGSDPICGVSGWEDLPTCLTEEEFSQTGKVASGNSSATGTILNLCLFLLVSTLTFLV